MNAIQAFLGLTVHVLPELEGKKVYTLGRDVIFSRSAYVSLRVGMKTHNTEVYAAMRAERAAQLLRQFRKAEIRAKIMKLHKRIGGSSKPRLRRELVRLAGSRPTRLELAEQAIVFWCDVGYEILPRIPRSMRPFWRALESGRHEGKIGRYPKATELIAEMERHTR